MYEFTGILGGQKVQGSLLEMAINRTRQVTNPKRKVRGYIEKISYVIFLLSVCVGIAGLILLVAMIGSIVLTLRQRTGVKKQKIYEQVSISSKNQIEKKNVPLGRGIE